MIPGPSSPHVCSDFTASNNCRPSGPFGPSYCFSSPAAPGTFNKECPFHSMEAHKHLWTMYHAEPDLWLLLVVGRHFVGPDCLPSSLTGLLKGLHSLAALLHGLLSTQLDQVGGRWETVTRVNDCVFLLLQAPFQKGAGHVLVHGRRLKLLPCRPACCVCRILLGGGCGCGCSRCCRTLPPACCSPTRLPCSASAARWDLPEGSHCCRCPTQPSHVCGVVVRVDQNMDDCCCCCSSCVVQHAAPVGPCFLQLP